MPGLNDRADRHCHESLTIHHSTELTTHACLAHATGCAPSLSPLLLLGLGWAVQFPQPSMTAAFSSPPRVAASGSRRSTTPQRHVFHEPLVIRPMSPMRRFWGGTCRAIAVGLFWLLVALVACRILLPGVFKAGAALAPTPQPVTVPKKQADGTTVNVLSPTHEALLSGMGACSITQDAATCPFASASDLAATSAALGAVEERVRGMQALKEQVEGLSGALDALKASGVDRDGEVRKARRLSLRPGARANRC